MISRISDGKIKLKKEGKFENTQSNIQSKIRFYCTNIDLLLNKNGKWLLNFVNIFCCMSRLKGEYC